MVAMQPMQATLDLPPHLPPYLLALDLPPYKLTLDLPPCIYHFIYHLATLFTTLPNSELYPNSINSYN